MMKGRFKKIKIELVIDPPMGLLMACAINNCNKIKDLNKFLTQKCYNELNTIAQSITDQVARKTDFDYYEKQLTDYDRKNIDEIVVELEKLNRKKK